MLLFIFSQRLKRKIHLQATPVRLFNYFINHWDTEIKILTDITLYMLKSYMHIKKINHITSSELDVFKHFFHRTV